MYITVFLLKAGEFMFYNRILSVDIGSKNTKLLACKLQGNNVIIEDTFLSQTPIDSFSDGRIDNINNIKDMLEKAITNKKTKTKKVVYTIESSSIITRELVIPYSKNKMEIETMVKFELEQYLPIMLNDYIVEFKILEELLENDIKKLRVLVAALPKTIVQEYIDLTYKLKLTPIALDIHSNSISKVFSNTIRDQEDISINKTIAVIDMGYTSLEVNIISKGINRFSRILNLGGKDIDISIANSFNLSLEDAEKKKIENGNLYESFDNSNSVSMLNNIIKHSVEIWITELQRLFQYYLSRDRENSIDIVYIYGGSSKLKGITDYFTQALNIPTYCIESFSNVKNSMSSNDLDISIYLNAVGAVIGR